MLHHGRRTLRLLRVKGLSGFFHCVSPQETTLSYPLLEEGIQWSFPDFESLPRATEFQWFDGVVRSVPGTAGGLSREGIRGSGGGVGVRGAGGLA